MKSILKAYGVVFIVFGAVDLAWISMVAAPMFKEALQDFLVPAVRIAPAIAFYVLFPAGLIFFAIRPALTSNTTATAFVNGGLFGLFTYATYDLTNYATLKGWTLQITLIDIAYGAIVSACVATCGAFVAAKRPVRPDADGSG